MRIEEIISWLDAWAPPSYQEDYDNGGLITGSDTWECSGCLVTLDITEQVVQEAAQKNCNLIVTHHPIIFRGLKKIDEKNYVGQAVIAAIKLNIAIYAIHTSLDNVLRGVNGRMADQLGLINRRTLAPAHATLSKLFCFVPTGHEEAVRNAVFGAGGGHIGNYSETSFNIEGFGSFKAGGGAKPFVGDPGKRHIEKEIRIEIIFPSHLKEKIVRAMVQVHPYEEVAYDIVDLANEQAGVGSGLIGDLADEMDEKDFLQIIQDRFRVPVVRHSRLTGQRVRACAICGGAGSFLISKALAGGVDFFITADVKYHEFFDANDRIVLADIGHFESEQFTIDLLHDILLEKFPNFAVRKTTVNTNPVHYFL